MKRINLSLVGITMLLGAITAVAAGNFFGGSKNIVLKPGETKSFVVVADGYKKMSVRARADKGKVHIKVLDYRSRKVVKGKDRVVFYTGTDTKNKFRLVFTNKTKETQKVKTSWSR